MKRYIYSHSDETDTFPNQEGFDTPDEAEQAADAHPERPRFVLDRFEPMQLYALVSWRDASGVETWERCGDARYDDRG